MPGRGVVEDPWTQAGVPIYNQEGGVVNGQEPYPANPYGAPAPNPTSSFDPPMVGAEPAPGGMGPAPGEIDPATGNQRPATGGIPGWKPTGRKGVDRAAGNLLKAMSDPNTHWQDPAWNKWLQHMKKNKGPVYQHFKKQGLLDQFEELVGQPPLPDGSDEIMGMDGPPIAAPADDTIAKSSFASAVPQSPVPQQYY